MPLLGWLIVFSPSLCVIVPLAVWIAQGCPHVDDEVTMTEVDSKEMI